MPLSVGTSIGPYEILAPIGAGGMGEVYRARDTKLKREVALKVLPEAFARDPDRMARFQREAEVLASLNHPNIAHLYGIEERALVMELVGGETLPCPLPVEIALQYAKQIADALEYAHERGVIHRDLKPANVKVTPEGAVKILDFGLAKALDERPSDADPENSPTLTLGATRVGMILGTAAYMSPEQASGRKADRRADIWSFGAVLYEMLAGKRAFAGESVSDTLATVLKLDPDWDALPAETPVSIRKLVQRCLTKDRKQRLQAIGEARIALENPRRNDPVAATAPLPSRLRWAPWAVAGVLSVALGALAFVHFSTKTTQPAGVTFTVEPPAGGQFGLAYVSPDGRQVALVARLPRGAQLMIRGMESLTLRPIPGTEGMRNTFAWSPDSRKIVFAQGEQIKTVDLTAGSIQSLCSADRPSLSDWGFNGIVLFSAAVPGGKTQVYQVPATGGSPRVVIPLDTNRNETSQTDAQFLPGGKRFLYRSQGQADSGLYVASLDGKQKKLIKSGYGTGFYLNDAETGKSYLLLCDGNRGACLAQRFDTGALELTGDPVILPQVPAFARVEAAPAGLVYTALRGSLSKLAWYSRDGKELEAVSEVDTYYSHELSPDNRQVAWELMGGPKGYGDIWVKDLIRGSKLRLTSDSGWEYTQRFWPDGSKIAYMGYHEEPPRFYIAIKPANGAGSEKLVLESPIRLFLGDVSPDGAIVLYDEDGPPSTLWVLPLTGDRRPVLFRRSQGDNRDGRFSPDGRWIAYASSDSGQPEIQVQDFVPDGGAAQRTHGGVTVVSTQGGSSPRWSKDGKELFYLAPDDTLMTVAVKTSSQFTAGKPQKLFRLPGRGNYRIPYAVSADSRRFLIAVPDGGNTEAPLVVVTHWMELLIKEQ